VWQLAKYLSKKKMSLGILCIDPSSPFTGGAFLGDRVRMTGLNDCSNIYIRSLSTRGSLGGVSSATRDLVRVLDAAGNDAIIVETVGTGQVEHDIISIADTTVMVTVPGLGDGIQTLKAGIMEIADIFVVNKSDRDGADETVRDLEMMLSEVNIGGWQPQVTKTSAASGEGIAELSLLLTNHHTFLKNTGLWQQKRLERNKSIIHKTVTENIMQHISCELDSDSHLLEVQRLVREGACDPYTAAVKISDHILANFQKGKEKR